MSPDALTGARVGECVLQRVLGEGTIGTVYLAHQAQLQRQVVVKVFFPGSSIEKEIQEAFQQRLAQALTVNASLDHANILSILDLGKQEEYLYAVMPYVAGGNLLTILNGSAPLPLTRIQHYLKQLAAALDYAHARGVLHRDLKPENVLITPEQEILLGDFALTSLTTEKEFMRFRHAASGMLNYIAPEYVLGRKLDQRADLYSLGALLYHMVTGVPPFQGTTLGEVAKKHISAPPLSPRSLRTDLSAQTEEVILRALAKDPDERYVSASDLATAFLATLGTGTAVPSGDLSRRTADQLAQSDSQSTNALVQLMDLAAGATSKMARVAPPNGNGLRGVGTRTLAPDPVLNSAQEMSPVPHTPVISHTPLSPSMEEQQLDFPVLSSALEATSRAQAGSLDMNGNLQQDRKKPGATPPPSGFPGRGLKRTGLLGTTSFQTGMSGQFSDGEERRTESSSTMTQEAAQSSREQSFAPENTQRFMPPQFPGMTDELRLSDMRQQPERSSTTGLFGAYSRTASAENPTGTMKLTEPVKIVQVPIAGQPGHFMTGFLPVIPPEPPVTRTSSHPKRRVFVAGLLLLLLLVAAGSGILIWTAHSPTHSANTAQVHTNVQLNPMASATARATATLGANIILSDDLSQNIHNWPVNKQGSFFYAFKDGAYHITNSDEKQSAPALLPDEVIKGSFAYSLTMEQIKGDMTSPNNLFGMILYATDQNKVTRFYTFEVLNKSGGQYQFNQYDNSHQDKSPWTTLWTKDLGKEFHQGSGPAHQNTVKVVANGKTFTFIVNGKQVGTWKGGSLASGSIGMLVNLNGSEVAFSKLLLSYT